MFRSELKFIINKYQMQLLKHNLDCIMERDSNSSSDGSYFIRSLYFDDYKDTAYNQVLEGISERQKYRIRYYNYDSSFIRLENKYKKNNFNRKTSTKVNKEEVISFINNEEFITENDMLNSFKTKIKTNFYKPVVIIDYNRDAYIYKAGNVRITFDYNLTCSYDIDNFFEKDIDSIPLLDKDQVILEVKFDEFLPSFIRQILNVDDIEITSFSKYANGRTMLKKVRGV